MKKLSAYVCNNSELLFNKSIEKVGCFFNDFSKENIIIVPDRLSLITEQNIFKILNIDIYFNISVMGISKFANKIIKNNGLNFLECTNNQSKLLTLKAIQNTKNNFKCFSKSYTLGFIDEIFAKIEQIKSSNANIDDLIDENASIGTKLKYNDLKLIYNEYEKLRGERLDSGSLLSIFNNISSESEYLKNCNVFFIGFDSITRQGLEVIKNTTKYAHSCFVSILAPDQQPNQNLYDKSFLSSIESMCFNENFEKDIIYINKKLENPTKEIIQNNIFFRGKTFTQNNYFNIYKASSVNEEIDFIVKSINYNIKKYEYNFNDFAICAPDSVSEKIKSKLNNVGIDCYLDLKTKLINLEPIKYLLGYLKYLNEPSEKKYILQIITNEFCNLSKENKNLLINLINKFQSLNIIKKTCETNNEIMLFINGLLNLRIDKNNTIKNYLCFIEKLIDILNIYSKNNELCEILSNKNEIFLEKTYSQLEEKLSNIITEIDEILNYTTLDFTQFLEIFENSITNSEISVVPSTTNQVFIGNIKSFYNNPKYIYIVGVNENEFPKTLFDNGLISDKEINSDSLKAVLEPTTKVINKRNKIKALDTLLSAKEKCYLSYHSINSDGATTQPSEFIDELKYLFSYKEINISSLTNIENTSNEDLLSMLSFNVIDAQNGNLICKTQNNNINNIILKSLKKCNNFYVKPTNHALEVDFNKLFFKDNKLSVSLIEKYNSCPKSCFLSNGIKLKKEEQSNIQANIIGTFMHEVIEKFVNENKANLGILTEDIIKSLVTYLCNNVVKNDKYFSLCLEENKFVFNLICKECIRFCSFLNHEQTISNFKPMHTEKYFGKNSNFKPIEITLNGSKYYISGIVDRIDFCDDYFRIIDYKSGNSNFKNLKDGLFYGTKLQLFIYALAIDKNLDKNFFGAFYLPINNTFKKNNQSNYTYIGFFIDSIELAQKCDNSLTLQSQESKLLGCKFNKPKSNGTISFRKNDNIISTNEYQHFEKYAIEIIKASANNMINGHINCSPIKDACNHCEFNTICKNNKNKNIERDKLYGLTNEIFMEIKYE